VRIPIYERLQTNARLGERILEILMRGVSTRNCHPALPEAAGLVESLASRLRHELPGLQVAGTHNPRFLLGVLGQRLLMTRSSQ